jgi:hypothetical protein
MLEASGYVNEALDISAQRLGHNHYYAKGLAESLVDLFWEQQRDDEARDCTKVYRLDVQAEL